MKSDSSSDESSGSSGDCSEDDARLGLCGVHIPNPAEQQLKDNEAMISKQLDEKEAKSDEERKAIMLEINKQRLIKAKKLMQDLVDTDKRINDLVHHAVKVHGFFFSPKGNYVTDMLSRLLQWLLIHRLLE
jgi:hypothetical protein